MSVLGNPAIHALFLFQINHPLIHIDDSENNSQKRQI